MNLLKRTSARVTIALGCDTLIQLHVHVQALTVSAAERCKLVLHGGNRDQL